MKTKENNIKIKYLLMLLLVIPTLASAQFTLASATFQSFIMEIVSYIDLINPILIMTSLLVFGWGLSKVIMNSSNATEVKNGREYMIWGIIALFCLMAVYGIISFIQGEFGFSSSSVDLPTLLE